MTQRKILRLKPVNVSEKFVLCVVPTKSKKKVTSSSIKDVQFKYYVRMPVRVENRVSQIRALPNKP